LEQITVLEAQVAALESPSTVSSKSKDKP